MSDKTGKTGEKKGLSAKTIALLLLALAAAIGLLALVWRDPADGSLFFPPCLLHRATGLHCPGCGSLRALHRLLHGRVADAFAMNPLMAAALPVLGLLLLKPAWAVKPWVAWLALALLIGYGIARNIPCEPFLLLTPK